MYQAAEILPFCKYQYAPKNINIIKSALTKEESRVSLYGKVFSSKNRSFFSQFHSLLFITGSNILHVFSDIQHLFIAGIDPIEILGIGSVPSLVIFAFCV